MVTVFGDQASAVKVPRQTLSNQTMFTLLFIDTHTLTLWSFAVVACAEWVPAKWLCGLNVWRLAGWLTALTFPSRQTTADFTPVALTSVNRGVNECVSFGALGVFRLNWVFLLRCGVLMGLWSVILGAGLCPGMPQSLNDLRALLTHGQWLTGAAQLEEIDSDLSKFTLDLTYMSAGRWGCESQMWCWDNEE